jgi:hypothetical protein
VANLCGDVFTVNRNRVLPTNLNATQAWPLDGLAARWANGP